MQRCFNNKGNLLCTLTEPQQRSNGRSRPQSLQMNAECFRVTVNCTLNSVLWAPSRASLTSSLFPVKLIGAFTPPGFNNMFLKGAYETISDTFCPLFSHCWPQSIFPWCLSPSICDLLRIREITIWEYFPTVADSYSHDATWHIWGKANIRVTVIIYSCLHSNSAGSVGTLSFQKDLLEEKWGEDWIWYGWFKQSNACETPQKTKERWSDKKSRMQRCCSSIW